MGVSTEAGQYRGGTIQREVSTEGGQYKGGSVQRRGSTAAGQYRGGAVATHKLCDNKNLRLVVILI